MGSRTITVTIPERLFLQLEAAARSSAVSLDAMLAQSLERVVPPNLAALLPATLQAELDAMEHLSDEALRAIAYSTVTPERVGERDTLAAQEQGGGLSEEQRARLAALRAEAEALMVRKAHAFVLLKSRGHTPPSPDQLPLPSA
jgi:hypothetical protein